MKFNDFNFEANLQEGLDSMGFETPTPIQEQAIPIILAGKDLIGSDYELVNQASGIVCMTAITGRVTDKYGWLGIRLCLIDVGQIAQNMSLIAEALGLGYRPIAGFSNEKIDNLINIDGQTEMTLLTYLLG